MSFLHKIGITGGMGSGKSSLLKHLSKQSRVTTIDLDVLAFRNYDLNKWSTLNLRNSFGRESVLANGKINKTYLSNKVFKNDKTLAILRDITSPGIKSLLLEKFEEIETQNQHDIVAVEGAILTEANMESFFDDLWVLTLDKETAF